MRIERAIVLSDHTDDHPSSNNNFTCLSAVPDHLVLEEHSTERSIKALIGAPFGIVPPGVVPDSVVSHCTCQFSPVG